MSALGFCIFFFFHLLQGTAIGRDYLLQFLAVFREFIENSDVSEVLTENNTGFHLSTNLYLWLF